VCWISGDQRCQAVIWSPQTLGCPNAERCGPVPVDTQLRRWPRVHRMHLHVCLHQNIQHFPTQWNSPRNDKAEFKAALSKYLHTHCFYCVDGFFYVYRWFIILLYEMFVVFYTVNLYICVLWLVPHRTVFETHLWMHEMYVCTCVDAQTYEPEVTVAVLNGNTGVWNVTKYLFVKVMCILWELTFSHWCCWSLKASWKLCCVVWRLVPDFAKVHSIFFLRVKRSKNIEHVSYSSETTWLSRWRHCDCL